MFTATDASPSTTQAAAYPARAALPGQKPERSTSGKELSESEERKLKELRETDQRVRRHEEAHKAAAGSLYRGGPNYSYETGPDGKRYAVSGSVQIDTSPGRTPEETVQKAARIRRAALAPVDPSGTDRAVASKATRMEDAARRAMVRDSVTSEAAPQVRTTKAPPLPIRERSDDDATPAANAPEASRIDVAVVDLTASIESVAAETLSPGDLGGEVWASTSALSDSSQLKQERRADGSIPTPHVDVMA